MSGAGDGLSFPTSLGTSTADAIRLLGQNLPADLRATVGMAAYPAADRNAVHVGPSAD